LDSISLAIQHKFKDTSKKVDDLKFSPDGRFLAVGNHDDDINVYFLEQEYKKIGSCKGHSAHITHLDWSEDSKVMQSDSGSYEHLFWDVEDLQQITKSTSIRDLQWKTWTCILGWHVKGVWPPGADGTDINALCRSADGKLVATADDFGEVKIFRFPVDIGAEFRAYSGHSAHVSNIRFSVNDTHVISAGGNDRTIFQWKVVGGHGQLVPPPETPNLPPPSPRIKKSASNLSTHEEGADEGKLVSDLQHQDLLTEDQAKLINDILNDHRKERIQKVLAKLRKEPQKAAEFSKELEAIL